MVPTAFPSRSHRLNPVVGEAKAALAYQPDSMFEQAPPSHREQYPAGSPIGVGGGGVGTALDLFDTSVRSVCEWPRLWLVLWLVLLFLMMMMMPPALHGHASWLTCVCLGCRATHTTCRT